MSTSSTTSSHDLHQLQSAVRYRPIAGEGDIPRLRVLHDAVFPLRYDDRFYNWLLTTRALSVVAVVDLETYSKVVSPLDVMKESDWGSSTDGGPPAAPGTLDAPLDLSACLTVKKVNSKPAAEEKTKSGEDEESAVEKHPGSANPNEVIIGFIVGRVKHVDQWGFTHPIGYISTFGVHSPFRRLGLGCGLLDRLLAQFQELPQSALANPSPPVGSWMADGFGVASKKQIKEIWLHMWTANTTALRFYTRRHFEIVRTLTEYYNFHNAHHDAHVMRYRIGGMPIKRGESGPSAAGAGPTDAQLEQEVDMDSAEAPQKLAQQPQNEEPSAREQVKLFLLAACGVLVFVAGFTLVIVGTFKGAQHAFPPPPLPT